MTDRHQELMLESFNIWEESQGMDRAEWMFRLSFGQRVGVLTGTLNYQVENGGFAQWHENDYSEFSQDLLRVLKLINTEATVRVSNLVRHVMNVVDNENHEREELMEVSDWASDEFYTFNKQYLADVESFLQRESL